MIPKPTEKKRRRLSPEIRKKMILDQAAKMVASEGINQLSMERIAVEVNVSKALIYNYFQNITELLRELLDRELQALRLLQFKAAEKASTFEELVRNITHEYLKYIDERGLIIQRLQSEPSVSSISDPTGYGRDAAVDYLADIAASHFDLPIKLARAATDISFGLPASAGEYLLKSDIEVKELEDLTVTMIIGTFTMLKNDYLTKSKKIKL